MAQTTPTKRLPAGERREQILGVARRLLAERGYDALSMDEVAAAVGVTKPVLY
ncbi:MAG: helix-turn-helix domain-containing protein, partial [Actinomycetota bacterium]